MTNMEKFMKVFHIDYVDQKAISACFLCPDDECKKTECHDCRYQKTWWNEEYTVPCDPEKNTECRKTLCQDICFRTTHEEYAKEEDDG